PLLRLRPGLHAAPGDPDVLPRRPALPLRPDPGQRARTGPAPADRRLRPRRHRTGVGAGLPVGHRAPGRAGDPVREPGPVNAEAPVTPAQTVGPFLSLGLAWPDGPCVVDPATPGAVRIGGRLLDGRGDPVGDGMIETWQAGPDGRLPEADGRSAGPPAGSSGAASPGPPAARADPGSFRGFGRCLTDARGAWEIVTLKPAPLPAPGGATEAPHLDVSVFARGLLHRLVTRIYFADEEVANAV